MQGDELKALRKQLGMTQGEFADALGLTGTFIGLMERGEKPIELRTELAARYLARDFPNRADVDRRLQFLRDALSRYHHDEANFQELVNGMIAMGWHAY